MDAQGQSNHLAAKVAAWNRLHVAVREYTPKLQAALAPFIGKKVLNQGYVISEKVKAAVCGAVLENNAATSLWLHGSMFHVRAEFRVCEHYTGNSRGDTFACYAETSVNLGEQKEHVLTALSPFDPAAWRIDYSEAEVIEARKELEAAREQVRAAEFKLANFGEHDNS